jgi:oxidoreductase, zinc-binding dehydrogenase family
MKALIINRHDRFDGLDYSEAPAPVPGPGEVSIDVQYAGVGLIDALWTTGFMPSRLGRIPGLEVSGTIRELGEGVTGCEIGQAVAAILPNTGGFAEVVCTPAELVAPIPNGLRPDLAAVVPINTVTAHLALTTVARFVPGERVLIHAGVGGLGSQFGQVARVLGAGRIDAVVGTEAKQASAAELGYDNSYLRSDLSSIPGDTYDIVIDPVGGKATEDAFRVLRSGGRLIRVGNASQAPDVAINSTQHWLQNKTTAGFNVGAWLAAHPAEGTASLTWSLNAVADGKVRVDLTEVTDITEAAHLLEALEQGKTTGKVALRVKP